jgi:hypothetical protein
MTFPSHAAAVLPFKFARRRWFDGVALVIGSAAPDFPYSIAPYVQYNAHTWLGLLVFCVPATVLLTWLTRRAAPAVVAHLPRWTSDYAALRQHRFPVYVRCLSAWIGACSHRLWDLVTHAGVPARGTQDWTWLNAEAFAGQPWWRVLHYGSTVAGALLVLAAARHIHRTRWLLTDGPAVPAPADPRRFWTVVAVICVPGVAVQPFLAWFTEPQALIVRLLELGCLALLAAAWTTNRYQDPARITSRSNAPA